MANKKKYANGQKVYEYEGKILTNYFKNGKVKSKGFYINEKKEGKWLFYRQTGQLWRMGSFNDGKKEGVWKRFDKDNQLEYEKVFKIRKVNNK